MIKCLSRVKRAIALFSLLCLVLLPATIVCGDSRAAGEAGTTGNIMASPGTIRLDPSPATADVGEPVTTYVWLENGADYYGIDIRFRFDEDLVSIPSGHVTPLWDVFDESNQMIIKNQVDDGLIWYSITNLNPAGPFTGTGRICSITLVPLVEGLSALDLCYAKGATRDGDPLFPTQSDGLIKTPGAILQLYLPIMQVGESAP